MKKIFLGMHFIFFLGCTIGNKTSTVPWHQDTQDLFNPAMRPFYHGVASGDPNYESITIWTRVTPGKRLKSINGTWSISTGNKSEIPIQSGEWVSDPGMDYTVKVRVSELVDGASYRYWFTWNGIKSPIGKTKTLPIDIPAQLKLAVVSCNNYEAGYYNAFARLAERDDIQAIIHLGDYIYEYQPGVYGDRSLNRKHLPPKEIITLNDYRTRYAQYRTDSDLQRAHQAHPFITIWDDHEISNNSYRDGAQNHQASEGKYADRKAAARQAYYEWLPVNLDGQDRLYRSFNFGSLLKLIMLDERLEGRTATVGGHNKEEYQDTSRSMLGPQQRSWLFDQLNHSKAIWNFIGNQVIFSDVNHSPMGWQTNMDSWDGYPAEKKMILNKLYDLKPQNTIFLSGDTHSSWAFEVPLSIDDYQEHHRSIAVELGTPSITSANSDESEPRDTVLKMEQEMVDPAFNPHLKYINLRDHGYLLLTIRPTEIIAEWIYVDRINQPSIKESKAERLRVLRGSNFLTR